MHVLRPKSSDAEELLGRPKSFWS
eukprot:SAG31_NODE_206_length_20335_cov_17.910160_1_plen_23_part_10